MASRLRELLDSPDFPEPRCWQRRGYGENEVIVREGDPAHDLYVVLSGAVRVSGTVPLEGRREMHPGYCDLEPGAVFGELCLFDDQPRSATVTSVGGCELAVIPRDSLVAHLDAHPEVGYPILKDLVGVLVDRMRTANRRFVSIFSWGLKAHHLDRYL
jgi:CRP-like cAMP-binding protein